jgi:RHS repeat-associated protein
MNSDSQSTRVSRIRWALAALVLTAVGVAIAETADNVPTDAEVQAAVDKSTAVPFPELGGPRAAGAEGEVSLGGMRASYSYTDVTVKSVMGPVSFVRYYGMDTSAHTTPDLNTRPEFTPFGSMRADPAADLQNGLLNEHCGVGANRNNCRGGLRWWHNFESWVEYTAREIRCEDESGECQDHIRYEITWIVHAPDGQTYSFDACLENYVQNSSQVECYALNHADPDVKLVLKYADSGYGDAFVLHTPTARYVYAEPLKPGAQPDRPGMVGFRLSYILSPQRVSLEDGGSSEATCPEVGPDNPCQRRLATLHYGSICTAEGTAVRNGADTYVTQIDVAGAGALELQYTSVYLRDRKQLVNILADGGTDGEYIPPKECVLSKVLLKAPQGDSTPKREVASYTYAQGPFQEDTRTTPQTLGGLLSHVTLSPSGVQGSGPGLETYLSYEYGEAVLPKDGGPSLQPLRTFRVRKNGLFEREFVVDAADGSYVKQTQVGDTKVSLWAGNNGYASDGGADVSYCHPGNFKANGLDGAGKRIYCKKEQTQYQQVEAVLAGNGTGTLVPGVQQKSKLEVFYKSPNGPLVTGLDSECQGAACNALAPQQRSRSWGVTGYDPCVSGNCPTAYYRYFPYAPEWTSDSRGNKTVYGTVLAPADAGVPPPPRLNAQPPSLPHVAVNSVQAGATDNNGSNALQTRYFSYAYVGHYEQKLRDEYGASVLQPAADYRIRRHYDVATGRLTGVVQRGYTLGFTGSGASRNPVERNVGTFYRTRYSCNVTDNGALARAGEGDAWGRIVEVAGPCEVSKPNSSDPLAALDAQACADGQPSVPLTQYEYFPPTAGPRLAGRLAVRRVFSRTAGDGTCNTPGGVDPNSYVETHYDDYDVQGRLTEWHDENGLVTKYVYSGDKLVEARVADKDDTLVAVTKYGYDNGGGTGNWVRYPDGRYEVQCFRENTAPSGGCSGGVLTDKLQWKATARSAAASNYRERTDYLYAANGQLVGEEVRDSTGVVRRKRYFEGDPLGRTTYEATGSSAPEVPSDSRYHQVSLFDMEGNRVGLGLPYQPTSSPLEPLCGGFAPQSTQNNALPNSTMCKAFEYDRLNRLSRLTESLDLTQGGLKATTCLTYDSRGNLASVSRAGPLQACAPNAESSIRYVHDDFGNLVQVLAPWARGATDLSGEYDYAYDAVGNLVFKQTPAMRHEAAPTWVQYSYDAMRRVLTAQADSTDTSLHPQTLYAYGYDGQVTPPSFCPGNDSNPDGKPYVKGRPQVLTDSFGDTWYAYDVHGNPRAHWRVRASEQPARTKECTRANTPDSPNRWFFFDTAGRMINEVLPGGRQLTYVYYGNDTGLSHRVSEVRAATWNGTAWSTMMTLIKDVQWEPYGGVKSYAVQTHLSTGTGSTLWRYVDYLRTAPATVPLSLCNETNIASGNDFTGRLKALTVSTEAARNAGHPGDIYKRVYTWKADQVVREDTCVLETGNVPPEKVEYAGPLGEAGYDTRGQLSYVSGRPYDLRTYLYDALGNRLGERRGNFFFQLGYSADSGGVRGELLRTRGVSQCASGDPSCLSTTPLTSPTEDYVYDDDGRLAEKRLNGTGQGTEQLTGLAFGTGLDEEHAALGAVYKSVAEDFGDTWEYFYDAQGRRRLKLYSTGAREEYFYDKTALLEDWSVTCLTSTQPDSVRDEYIWLDGRPVALFKTRVNHTGGRVADFTGTCERFSDDVAPACGVYFPITDMLGKPVMMLDGAGLVTGVADYDSFGHVNRITHPAESPHPSTNSGGQRLLLETSTALPALRSGISVQVRGRFTYLMGKNGSEAFLADGTGGRLTPASGTATSIPNLSGRSVATPWVNAASTVRVYFREPATTPGALLPWGASLEGLEYRRFQAGATPVWLPLRLPGQYHDAETDLFENWNRYYDPSIGRYLGPEPMYGSPGWVLQQAYEGSRAETYGYAHNNPIAFTDPDGNSADVAEFCMTNPVCAANALAAAAAATTATVTVALVGAVGAMGALVLNNDAPGYADDGPAWTRQYSPQAHLNENKAGEAGQAAPGTPSAPATPEEAKAQADAETQAAIRDIVNSATNGGRKPLSVGSAETVLDWAAESSYPGARAGPTDVVGDHPGTQWDGKPHIHIPGAGRGGHVLVQPGVQPRDPKVFGGTK